MKTKIFGSLKAKVCQQNSVLRHVFSQQTDKDFALIELVLRVDILFMQHHKKEINGFLVRSF